MRTSLRLTTLIFVLAAFVSLVVLAFTLSNTVVRQKFGQLEETMARRNAKRAVNAVQDDLAKLESLVRDWAWWDDTVAFLRGEDPGYEDGNLVVSTFQDQHLSFMAFVDSSGRLAWGRRYDRGSVVLQSLPENLSTFLAQRTARLALVNAAEPERGFSGILRLQNASWILVCLPVLDSNRQGPSPGWLIMGQEISAAYAAAVSLRTELSVGFVPRGGELPPPLAQAAARGGRDLVAEDEDLIFSADVLPGLTPESDLTVVVVNERDVLAATRAVTRLNIAMIALAGLFCAGLAVFFLQRRVLSRLGLLTRQVREAARDRDGTATIELSGDDELSRLALDITGMLTTLRDNELLLAQIMDSLHVGIMLVEPEERRVVMANPFACKLLGRDEDELKGQVCHSFVCPSGPGECPVLDQGGQVEHARRMLIRADNTRLSVLKSVVPIRRKGSEYLLETFVDISELERTRGLLAESEERYRAIFMNTGTASIIVDADESIVLANSEFAHLTGATEEELAAHPKWTRYYHSEDLPRMREFHRLRRLSPRGAPRNYQCRLLHRPEGVRHVNMTVAMLPNSTLSIASMVDISAMKAAEEQLARQAFHDALTGLPNRQLFDLRLTHALETGSRDGLLVGVLLLDLDEFKNVNDSLGHPAGDEVLRQAAERARSVLRRADTLARFGGDEFTIILEHLESPTDLSVVAQQILATLEPPFSVHGSEVYLGVSIGIAIFPEDGDTPEKLVRNADLAMYRAKAAGKNTFHLYTPDLNEQAQERLEMDRLLRNALASDAFEVFYQPFVSLKPGREGRVEGMEALVRWRKPDGSLALPGEFIPFAEQSGLIMNIDLKVLRMACLDAARWEREGMGAPLLAVNLSAHHFRRGRVAEDVTAILRESGLTPSRLEIEITETAFMENLQSARPAIQELRALGVRFSLDDFGTGYSSLSYLKNLSFQKLKVDRAFVNLIGSEDGDALVRTILSMAANLGLNAVAEGVESPEQVAFLSANGCPLAQGYLYARPMPREELEALLRRALPLPATS